MLVGVLTGAFGSFSREGFVRSVRWLLSIGLCRGQRQGFSVGHGGWLEVRRIVYLWRVDRVRIIVRLRGLIAVGVAVLLVGVVLYGCEKPTSPEQLPPESVAKDGWWECVALGSNRITTPEERNDASEKIMGYINLILKEEQGSAVYDKVRAQVRDCMVELQQLGLRFSLQDSTLELHAPEGIAVKERGKWRDLPTKEGSASASTAVTFPALVLTPAAATPVFRRQLVEYYSGKKDTLESQGQVAFLRVPGCFVCDPIADMVLALGLQERGEELRKFGEAFSGFNAVLEYRGDNPTWVK